MFDSFLKYDVVSTTQLSRTLSENHTKVSKECMQHDLHVHSAFEPTEPIKGIDHECMHICNLVSLKPQVLEVQNLHPKSVPW